MINNRPQTVKAVLGIIVAILPWVLKLFGYDIPLEFGGDIAGLAASGAGAAIAADAKTK